MMRSLYFVLAALVAWTIGAAAFTSSTAPDPFQMAPGDGELGVGSYANTNIKTLVSSTLSSPSTTAVIITMWQSLIASTQLGTYATVNPTSYNFNIYDGGTYLCSNPALGATYAPSVGANSSNCQIADALITAGTYSHVVMVPIAVSGSLCADWVSGALLKRITVTVERLKTRGLTAGTGFTGQTWLVPHGGETDGAVGTPRATLAQCIRDFSAAWTTAGIGTTRFFVPAESIANNVANSTVINAQADAIASGCTNCRLGANVDSLTGPTNRQADGTHLTQTGAANLSALDVAVITNCKNTAC